MSKNKFEVKKAEVPKEAKNEYNYRTKGKRRRNKDLVTYSIHPTLADKIERWAYHARKDRSEIVEAILHAALKDKDFDPIPEDRPIEL